MTDLDVEPVLNHRLVEFTTAYPIDISYAGIQYNPVIGTSYIKPDLIPATNNSVGIGIDTKNRVSGILQLTIRVPAFEGKAEAKEIVDNLFPFLKRGVGIELNGVYVRILRFRLMGYSEDADWFTQIVRIEYRSDIEN